MVKKAKYRQFGRCNWGWNKDITWPNM